MKDCWICGYVGPTRIMEGNEDEGPILVCVDEEACNRRQREREQEETVQFDFADRTEV